MWDYLPIKSLMDMQRKEAVLKMGMEAKELYDQGYYVDCDRKLEEIHTRMSSWIPPVGFEPTAP